MNVWKCAKKNCHNVAIGIGSSVGLRSIGWEHVKGDLEKGQVPKTFCPYHHSKGLQVATDQAETLQELMLCYKQ